MVGTLRGRLPVRDAVSSKGKRAGARNTMNTAKQSTAATFRNIQRPYHGTGENRRIVNKNHKTPKCSNGYRQRGHCDSRPDWHKLTVLISSTARHDPHRRASGVHDPHRRGQRDHDPYRQGRPSRSVPASCDSAGLAQVQTYW